MEKILSIDFDYFVNADYDTREKYFIPGYTENVSLDIQNKMWALKYALYNNELLNITIDDSYKSLKNPDVVGLTNDEIINHISKQCQINTIDFHHDYYEILDINPLNSGNWLRYIDNTYNVDINWCNRETSSTELFPEKGKIVSFEDIINDSYNTIFTCLSPMFFPPHLDHHFTKYSDVNIDRYNTIKMMIPTVLKEYNESNMSENDYYYHLFNTTK